MKHAQDNVQIANQQRVYTLVILVIELEEKSCLRGLAAIEVFEILRKEINGYYSFDAGSKPQQLSLCRIHSFISASGQLFFSSLLPRSLNMAG